MAELRWHPLIQDWVMIASNRQGRPQMPKDFCPFCPSFGNVPDYEVLEYDNDFPALSQKSAGAGRGDCKRLFQGKTVLRQV